MSLPFLSLLSWCLFASAATASGSFNQSIDDPSPLLVYSPSASTLNASKPAWFSVAVSFANGGSVHTSQDPTARVAFNFTGTELYVWGTKKFDRGEVTVQIDQFPAETYDCWAPDDVTTSSVLYSKTGLDNAPHAVTLSNAASDPRVSGSHPWMTLDELLYTVPSTDTSSVSGSGGSTHKRSVLIAVATVGTAVVVCLVAAIVLLTVRWRRKRVAASSATDLDAFWSPLPPTWPPPAVMATAESELKHVMAAPRRSDSLNSQASWTSSAGTRKGPWVRESIQIGRDVYPGYGFSPPAPVPPAYTKPVPELMSPADWWNWRKR